MPKFSIAIPAFKSIFLRKAIDSVLNQSITDFELIILNDCSPEAIDDIVYSYDDKRIRYLKNACNTGVVNLVDNWNKCVEYARGDYFLCMGDDDILLPSCLEEYDKLINKYPFLEVFHGQTMIIDENDNLISAPFSRPEWESVFELIYFRLLGRKQFVGDFLYRTSFLKKKGFYKLPAAWGTDEITAVIAASEKGIANTHNVCFLYRSNPLSISSSGNIMIKIDSVEQEERWYMNFIKSTKNEEGIISYKKIIQKEIGKAYKKKKLRLIADDLMYKPLHFFKWLKAAGKYNLSSSMILYALFMSLRDLISISYQKKHEQ